MRIKVEIKTFTLPTDKSSAEWALLAQFFEIRQKSFGGDGGFYKNVGPEQFGVACAGTTYMVALSEGKVVAGRRFLIRQPGEGHLLHTEVNTMKSVEEMLPHFENDIKVAIVVEIGGMCVDEGYRGNGVGGQIYKATFEHLRAMEKESHKKVITLSEVCPNNLSNFSKQMAKHRVDYVFLKNVPAIIDKSGDRVFALVVNKELANKLVSKEMENQGIQLNTPPSEEFTEEMRIHHGETKMEMVEYPKDDLTEQQCQRLAYYGLAEKPMGSVSAEFEAQGQHFMSKLHGDKTHGKG